MQKSAGWSVDWRVRDPISGRFWDLSEARNIMKAKRMMKEKQCEVLVVRPPCTSEHPRNMMLQRHAAELCRWQEKRGGAWVLELSRAGQPGQEKGLKELVEKSGVAKFSLCLEGRSCDQMMVMTNSEVIASKIQSSEHKKDKRLETYCRGIVEAAEIIAQSREEPENQMLGSLGVAGDGEWCDDGDNVDLVTSEILADDIPNSQRTEELKRKARDEEIKGFQEMKVYHYANMQDMEEDSILVDTVWVEVNKGSAVKPEWRSRLCAREFNDGAWIELYAATPPLAATRLMISRAATRVKGKHDRQLMVLDVKKAFLYGATQRNVYIRLPAEDARAGEKGIVGKLDKAMYGTRDAPLVWRQEVKKTLEALDFYGSTASPCVYRHRTKDLMLVTHVDDFLVSGTREELVWLRERIRESFEIKGKILGRQAGEENEIEYLGRTIKLT